VSAVLNSVKDKITVLKVLREAGAMPPLADIRRLSKVSKQLGKAGAARSLALRYGPKTAIIDEQGELSYLDFAEQVDRCINAVVADVPRVTDRTIGLMCRNHRYMLIGLFGGLGSGSRVVFLNTDLGPKQLAAVCAHEDISLLLHDQEFGTVLDAAGLQCQRLTAWSDGAANDRETLSQRLARASTMPPVRPARNPSLVILTSGSSGTPRAADREQGDSKQALVLAGFLQKIPLRGSDRIYVGPPAFHGWGLIAVMSGLALGATVVLPGRFDALEAIQTVVKERCSVLIGVPTMLRRVMALPEEDLDTLPVGQLRIIGSGGSRMDSALVASIQQRFGSVLHNLYGATEASFITIATPEDLLADPGCAGRAPIGVEVAILRDGEVVPAGQIGDIYVRTASQISRYTDGGSKESCRGMMKTGDTGSLDAFGRLTVLGRSDGMIVSGGENVFPEELELVLARHPAVKDVKVVPVEDIDFGQRLAAILSPASPDEILDEDELTRYITAELSRSRVPKLFVVVPEIPRTATGKVSKATLDDLMTLL
jgi:fatty-acyl-CoA synthase